MYKKGDIVEVRITNIKPYGAFCEIGNINGLIHISEFSDFFVNSVEDFVQIGDIVEVEVLDYYPQKSQLKLSYKNIRKSLQKNVGNSIPETAKGFKTLEAKYKTPDAERNPAEDKAGKPETPDTVKAVEDKDPKVS